MLTSINHYHMKAPLQQNRKTNSNSISGKTPIEAVFPTFVSWGTLSVSNKSDKTKKITFKSGWKAVQKRATSACCREKKCEANYDSFWLSLEECSYVFKLWELSLSVDNTVMYLPAAVTWFLSITLPITSPKLHTVECTSIFRRHIWVQVNEPRNLNFTTKTKNLNSMVWVRERTIPTERPPLVGEVIANLCG
jgi:hypothetical protein